MHDDDQRAVTALSRDLVRQVAPAELPLHASVARAYFSGKVPRKRRSGDDDLLGFGVGEAVVMLAPMIIEFTRQVWEALPEEAASATAGWVVGLVGRIRRRFASDDDQEPPEFTVEELRYVREVGRRCAGNLPLTAEQQTLLVESLVGSLAAPETRV